MSLNTISKNAAAQAAGAAASTINDPKTTSLTQYIPTESITLYVAAVANQKNLQGLWSGWTPAMAYGACAALTLVIGFFLFVNKLPDGTKAKDVKWPWWPWVAAVVAFLAWGLSVPGNPYGPPDGPLNAWTVAAAAVAVSWALTYVPPFLKKLGGLFT